LERKNQVGEVGGRKFRGNGQVDSIELSAKKWTKYFFLLQQREGKRRVFASKTLI
jgi:hypothetical protein